MKKINKNKIKIFFVILSFFLAVYIIVSTFSKYKSEASSNPNIQTALYLLKEDYQSMNLNLNSMIPGTTPYVYTFSIANNDGVNRVETNLEYNLKIKTTTNLPLEYELFLNEDYQNPSSTNIIKTNIVEQDADGTYFRKIDTDKKNFGFIANEQNVYTLVVYFDIQYNNINYQNIIESVEIEIDSKQVI